MELQDMGDSPPRVTRRRERPVKGREGQRVIALLRRCFKYSFTQLCTPILVQIPILFGRQPNMPHFGKAGKQWNKDEASKEKQDRMKMDWRGQPENEDQENQAPTTSRVAESVRRDSFFNSGARIPSINRSDQSTIQAPIPQPESQLDKDGFQKVSHKRTSMAPKPSPQPSRLSRAPTVLNPSIISGRRNGLHAIASMLQVLHTNGKPFARQVVGAVVFRFETRRCTDPKLKVGEKGVYLDPTGRMMQVKKRYFIIIRLYGQTVAEIPIFTYGDRGLEGRPLEIRKEYMSVKPYGVTMGAFYNQADKNPVLCIDDAISKDVLNRRTMVARYTEITPREYECGEIAVVGHLDGQSVATLQEWAYEKSKLRAKAEGPEVRN